MGKRRQSGRSLPKPIVADRKPLLPSLTHWALLLAPMILAAIPFAYGKYLEFQTDDPFDGSLNIYHARSLLNGEKLGEKVVPSARPATLLVNVIGVALFGYSEVGPKLLQTLFQMAALGLMFHTLRKAYGLLPAAVALLLAAFFLSCPPFAKFGNDKAQYMTACTLIAACALMLRHLGGRWWWLVLSGAALTGAYFFKQTGLSVAGAITVYLLVQTKLHRHRWGEVGSDVAGLVVGSVVGLTPLIVFYVWQGSLTKFLSRQPMLPLFLGLAGLVVVYLIVRFMVGWRFLRQVRPRLWVALAALVVAVLLPLLIYFGMKDTIWGYLKTTPPFSWPIEVWLQGMGFLRQAGGAYVGASREVSDFLTQYNVVMGYYQSFVVPIGLSLVAISWWEFRWFWRPQSETVGLGSSSESAPSIGKKFLSLFSKDVPIQDRFVLLLSIWWLLDMVSVWISPRSYVQYYLPLNGSGAMLAAYAVYRCHKQPGGYLAVLGAWLLTEVALVWIIPSHTFPYISWRQSGPEGFWGSWLIGGMTLAAAVVVYVVARKKPSVRQVILPLICGAALMMSVHENVKAFRNKIGQVKSAPNYAWKEIAKLIRSESAADEGLFVWGWYPGIYVEAQRSSPVSRPAEANMHTLRSEQLQRITKKLVQELEADPPAYIVDSQKIHFPFFSHPVFDLWPRWQDVKTQKFYLRYQTSQPVKQQDFLSFAKWEESEGRMYDQVEETCYQLLIHPQRRGGPVDLDRARELARMERPRHEVMAPLREFVMQHYEPLSLKNSPMILFKRKSSLPVERAND